MRRLSYFSSSPHKSHTSQCWRRCPTVQSLGSLRRSMSVLLAQEIQCLRSEFSTMKIRVLSILPLYRECQCLRSARSQSVLSLKSTFAPDGCAAETAASFWSTCLLLSAIATGATENCDFQPS